MEFATPQFWAASLEIVVINILLSGDNAVVIALACRNLPKRQRVLGIFWGVLGAVVLRIILTFFATQLLQLPWLQLVGAALLVWIGIKLIGEEDGESKDIVASDRLLAAVRTVIVADLVMSLDNVIGVAAAAHGSLLLLVFGLAVSIPARGGRQPDHHEADRPLPVAGPGRRRAAGLHCRRHRDDRRRGQTVD